MGGLRWPPGGRMGSAGTDPPPFPSPPSLRDRQATGFATRERQNEQAPTRITYQPGRGRFHAWFAAACCGGCVSVCERVGKRCERHARTSEEDDTKDERRRGASPHTNQRGGREAAFAASVLAIRNDQGGVVVSRWRYARNDRRVRLGMYEDWRRLPVDQGLVALALAPWCLARSRSRARSFARERSFSVALRCSSGQG